MQIRRFSMVRALMLVATFALMGGLLGCACSYCDQMETQSTPAAFYYDATTTVGTPLAVTPISTGAMVTKATVSSGTLPPGMTLDASGKITGTPTQAGVYPLVILLCHGNVCVPTPVTITVNGPHVDPIRASYLNASTVVGTALTVTPTVVTGGPSTSTRVVQGTLPPGMTLNPVTGVIQGTPTSSGVYTVSVEFTNASGAHWVEPVTITVSTASSTPLVGNYTNATGSVGTSLTVPPTLTSGGPAVSSQLASGTLPPGMTLNPDGTLTGTPTQPGTYTAMITLRNASGGMTTIPVTVVVNQPGVTPLTATYSPVVTVVNGTVNLAPTIATGGPVAGANVVSGSLPPGLTLNPDGTITGVATTSGVFTLEVRLCNAGGACTVVPVTITVTNPTLALSYVTPLVFSSGSAIPVQNPTLGGVVAGSTPSFAITSGSLPPGLTLNADGTITGTPTTPGVYSFTVTTTQGSRTASAQVSYTVTPAGALGLSYNTPRSFGAGTAITTQVPALQNVTPGLPTTYAVTTGSLPPGLTLNADGTITGTPTTPGVYSFTVTATNGSRTANAPVTYTVENASALTLTYPTPQHFPMGTAISMQTPTVGNATPGVSTTFQISSGSLPPGLTLNADGTITGTPTTPGIYNFTVTATNGTRTVSTPVSYTVENAGALTLSYPTPQTFTPNTPISSQLPTLGNATPGLPTTYAVTSGSLPAGLTLNADGTITGTPTTPGTYNFTVTATNGSRTATSNVQYVVTAAPTALNYTSPVDGTATVGIASNNPNPSGGTPTSYTVTGGSLPPGLTLNPTTGVISGTPTTPGDYTVTIQGSNAAGSTSQTVTYHVAAYPTASLTANPSVIPVNQAPALTALFTGALNGTAVISGGNLTSPMTVGTGTSIPAPAEAAPTVQTYTLTVTSPQGIIVTSTVTVQWVPVPSDIWTVTVHQDGTGSPYQPDPGHPLDGQIRIDVPNQGTSICGDSVLTVNRETALPGTLPASARNYSQTFNIASNQSYPFRVPITITLAYDPNGASPSLTAADLPVPFYWDANYGQWVAAGLKSVNTVAHTVSFTTLSPGRYVVLGIPGLTSVNQALDFLSARDDWRQLNPSIYDLPGGASLGMSSFAAWYQPFRKPTNGNVGLYNIFPNLTDANAASLISRLANGTQDNWKALWNQMGYALTDRQTGLALLTGLIISQQPQVFLMADQRSASPSTSLATAVYGFDNTTTPKRFKVMDTNYPGMSLTIAWDPSTGAFSAYDRAAGYAPAITQYAFEGQTSIHRLADYDRVFSGAQSGFPTGTYAVLSVTDVAGVSSPDLSQPIVVSSSANVTVTGTVTNGDAAATHIYWSQNGNAPRTAVPLTPVDATTSTFTFTIPQLSDPYNTTIAIETASNPCDPTFAHSGYREFTVKQIGLAPWFPNICFESGNSSPWTLEQGSNNAKLYPAAPTFGASGVTNYNITWNPASADSAIVTPGSDANLPAIHQVLDGSYAFRINNSASGAHVSRMYQTLTVPGTIAMPKLIFYWAAVMQDPGHSPAEQPFVDILVQDLSNPATPLYYQHFYAGSPTYPGWLTGSSGGWKGIPWQKVTLNLGPPPVLGGVPQDRSIRIMGVAADCTQTGHGGYVYIDGTNCQ